jgi:hypothetical protein
LTTEAITSLATSFERAKESTFGGEARQREQPRQRRRGGGRKSAIPTIEDKLLFVLLYFKIYPLREVQGLFFSMSQPQANFWIYRLTPTLNLALGYEMQLVARDPTDLEKVLEACPGLEFIINGIERPRQASQGPTAAAAILQRQEEVPHCEKHHH